MTLLIIDTQGGGMGRALVEKIRLENLELKILGVGTNAAATSALLKGGVDAAATGENAAVYNAKKADIIMGGAGILCANSMMGEISPAIAAAVSQSEAIKLVIPLNRCKLRVSGVQDLPMAEKLEQAIQSLKEIIAELKNET